MRTAGAALVVLLLAAAVSAGGVALDGPQVTRLGWSARGLTAADLDGDGRTDLAVLDNDHARLVLLYAGGGAERSARRPPASRWQPVLDDAPFAVEHLSTGIRMFALAAADLDGDGRTDLAYTGSPDGLTVRYQRSRGDFTEHRVLDVADPAGWPASLLADDLDGDRRTDLLVFTPGELLVWRQTADGELAGPRTYALPSDTSHAPRLLDVDGDGRRDLVYQVAQSEDAVRLRRGLPDGGLGPETAYRTGMLRGQCAPVAVDGASGQALAMLRAATGQVELRSFRTAERPAQRLSEVRPRTFSARVSASARAAYAFGDVDGDGRLDIAVADPRGARVWLHLQDADAGFGEAVSYPSLADVRSLAAADLDGDGRAELVMASPKERAVAVARLEPSGRLGFPRPLPTVGRPHAVVVADLDGDGSPEIASAHDDSDGRGVTVLRRAGDGWEPVTIALEGARAAPRGLLSVDADADGRLDLLVLLAREPARVLRQDADGSFVPLDQAAARGSLVDDLEPARVSVADVDGDGLAELLVTGETFTRALRVVDGALTVLDQYNPRGDDTALGAAASLDVDGDGRREVVLVRAAGDGLEVLERDRRGVLRSVESVPAGGLDLVGAEVLDLDGDGREDLLLLGARRFVVLPMGGRDLELETLAEHEPDVEDVSLTELAAGELDGAPGDELVVVDTRASRLLGVLSPHLDGAWDNRLEFTVFEVDPHYEGQRGTPSEPREVLVEDVTGDGRDDLVLLVHDRLLVYPQR